MKLSSTYLLILFMAIGSLVMVAAQDGCSQKRYASAAECSTCCAINNHNRFDRKEFNEKANCRCYDDEAEAKFNNQHKTPKKKVQSA